MEQFAATSPAEPAAATPDAPLPPAAAAPPHPEVPGPAFGNRLCARGSGGGHAPDPARAGPTLEESVAGAKAFLASLDDDRATAPWALTNGGTAVFTVPRIGLVRSLMLNHWYHHRGELQAYLRVLDLPVPAVYERSADESSF